MLTQCDRKRGSESARLKLMQEDVNAAKAGNILIDNCHYSTTSLALLVAEDMDEFSPLPITPSKSPASRKVMYTHSRSEQVNRNDIIASLFFFFFKNSFI